MEKLSAGTMGVVWWLMHKASHALVDKVTNMATEAAILGTITSSTQLDVLQ